MRVTPKHRYSNGFRERLKFLWFRWQAIHGRELTQTELAKTVGKLLGNDNLDQTTVGRWFRQTEPDLETINALARALGPGVDPGWLAFGADSKAPAPNSPVLDATTRLEPPDD